MAYAPIMYLSGIGHPGMEEALVKRAGCTHRCFSYAYACPGAFAYSKRCHGMLTDFLKLGGHVMMDSSAHSFHKFLRAQAGDGKVSTKKRKTTEETDQLREDTIKLYTEYCLANGKQWDFYVNFDFVQHCPTIYKMQKKLEKAGLRPVPVFHGDDSLDWFRRYVDEGHTLIGVSRSRTYFRTQATFKRYLDRVHDEAAKHNIRLHGFAMTSPSIMYMYPWHSVDSSTWVQCAIYGAIFQVDLEHHVTQLVRVSDRPSKSGRVAYGSMSKTAQKAIRDQVEGKGFDFDKVRTEYVERLLFNAYIFTHMAEMLGTDVGKGRLHWGSLV